MLVELFFLSRVHHVQGVEIMVMAGREWPQLPLALPSPFAPAFVWQPRAWCLHRIGQKWPYSACTQVVIGFRVHCPTFVQNFSTLCRAAMRAFGCSSASSISCATCSSKCNTLCTWTTSIDFSQKYIRAFIFEYKSTIWEWKKTPK
jgi:hypothetical protein